MQRLDFRAVYVGAFVSVAAAALLAVGADAWIDIPHDPSKGPLQALEEAGYVVLAGLVGFVIGGAVTAVLSRDHALRSALLAILVAYGALLAPLVLLLDDPRWYDVLILLFFPGALVVLAGSIGAAFVELLRETRARLSARRPASQ